MDSFLTIRDLFNRRFGILFNEGDRYMLETRLSGRVVELALGNFENYADYLTETSHMHELDSAIELVTNNETYFFREDYQLNAFTDEILPDVQRRNARKRKLNIWSAGCSSGEEVYSVAIFIVESGLFRGWDIRVFGSDINSKMLAKARNGHFGKSAFRNTPEILRIKYFRRSGAGWELNANIRDICAFGKINLLDTARIGLLGQFDVIFCRNVLMYFDKDSRSQTVDLFYNRLNPSGYLLLGHTESLFNQKTPFTQVELKNAMVYRKLEEAFA